MWWVWWWCIVSLQMTDNGKNMLIMRIKMIVGSWGQWLMNGWKPPIDFVHSVCVCVSPCVCVCVPYIRHSSGRNRSGQLIDHGHSSFWVVHCLSWWMTLWDLEHGEAEDERWASKRVWKKTAEKLNQSIWNQVSLRAESLIAECGGGRIRNVICPRDWHVVGQRWSPAPWVTRGGV